MIVDDLVCTVRIIKMPSVQPAPHPLCVVLNSFHCHRSDPPPHIHITVTLMLLFRKAIRIRLCQAPVPQSIKDD